MLDSENTILARGGEIVQLTGSRYATASEGSDFQYQLDWWIRPGATGEGTGPEDCAGTMPPEKIIKGCVVLIIHFVFQPGDPDFDVNTEVTFPPFANITFRREPSINTTAGWNAKNIMHFNGGQFRFENGILKSSNLGTGVSVCNLDTGMTDITFIDCQIILGTELGSIVHSYAPGRVSFKRCRFSSNLEILDADCYGVSYYGDLNTVDSGKHFSVMFDTPANDPNYNYLCEDNKAVRVDKSYRVDRKEIIGTRVGITGFQPIDAAWTSAPPLVGAGSFVLYTNSSDLYVSGDVASGKLQTLELHSPYSVNSIVKNGVPQKVGAVFNENPEFPVIWSRWSKSNQTFDLDVIFTDWIRILKLDSVREISLRLGANAELKTNAKNTFVDSINSVFDYAAPVYDLTAEAFGPAGYVTEYDTWFEIKFPDGYSDPPKSKAYYRGSSGDLCSFSISFSSGVSFTRTGSLCLLEISTGGAEQSIVLFDTNGNCQINMEQLPPGFLMNYARKSLVLPITPGVSVTARLDITGLNAFDEDLFGYIALRTPRVLNSFIGNMQQHDYSVINPLTHDIRGELRELDKRITTYVSTSTAASPYDLGLFTSPAPVPDAADYDARYWFGYKIGSANPIQYNWKIETVTSTPQWATAPESYMVGSNLQSYKTYPWHRADSASFLKFTLPKLVDMQKFIDQFLMTCPNAGGQWYHVISPVCDADQYNMAQFWFLLYAPLGKFDGNWGPDTDSWIESAVGHASMPNVYQWQTGVNRWQMRQDWMDYVSQGYAKIQTTQLGEIKMCINTNGTDGVSADYVSCWFEKTAMPGTPIPIAYSAYAADQGAVPYDTAGAMLQIWKLTAATQFYMASGAQVPTWYPNGTYNPSTTGEDADGILSASQYRQLLNKTMQISLKYGDDTLDQYFGEISDVFRTFRSRLSGLEAFLGQQYGYEVPDPEDDGGRTKKPGDDGDDDDGKTWHPNPKKQYITVTWRNQWMRDSLYKNPWATGSLSTDNDFNFEEEFPGLDAAIHWEAYDGKKPTPAGVTWFGPEGTGAAMIKAITFAYPTLSDSIADRIPEAGWKIGTPNFEDQAISYEREGTSWRFMVKTATQSLDFLDSDNPLMDNGGSDGDVVVRRGTEIFTGWTDPQESKLEPEAEPDGDLTEDPWNYTPIEDSGVIDDEPEGDPEGDGPDTGGDQ